MRGLFLGLTKVMLGIVVALLLMSLAGVVTVRYFMARLAVQPPKPIFENDTPIRSNPESVTTAALPADSTPAIATASPTPDPSASPEGYEAIIVQPIGMVLREGPGTTFQRAGGIDYNETVIVLEESADQEWMRVRLPDTGQEGWIKSGNTRRLD
ncbi:hypothetical protein XM38_001960 [Halomicronema hongdechloris C2206]|uniref:SH3b domain-containing protein n=1 Tax=Halomicronema hongdechloris C2206 TaxID=1641165 RepID=A0A1Z3HG31_9CYAN|nr:SH3 domain-containing protein [Halomicronema hongdechloris]ASC69269.1 hypothetical protein XM38_001960 [Halomicronema hongdechloris C2206]